MIFHSYSAALLASLSLSVAGERRETTRTQRECCTNESSLAVHLMKQREGERSKGTASGRGETLQLSQSLDQVRQGKWGGVQRFLRGAMRPPHRLGACRTAASMDLLDLDITCHRPSDVAYWVTATKSHWWIYCLWLASNQHCAHNSNLVQARQDYCPIEHVARATLNSGAQNIQEDRTHSAF